MPVAGKDQTGNDKPESIEALFAALESPLLRYAFRLVNNRETAQDLVQEAFMKLHLQLATVEQPRAWLYRTIHNQAVNVLRSSNRFVAACETESAPSHSEPSDLEPLPDEYIERMETIGQTRLSLKNLSDRQRHLIQLKFEEDMSYREMSEKTGLSVSNVGYILHHALKQLAEELKRSGIQL